MKKNTLRRLPSIPLEPELMERLERHCDNWGAKKTSVVQLALDEYLKRAPQKEEK